MARTKQATDGCTAVNAASMNAKRRSRWDETSMVGSIATLGATTSVVRLSIASADGSTTSSSGATPLGIAGAAPMTGVRPGGGATPIGIKAKGVMTPAPHTAPMAPQQFQTHRYEKELDERYKPLTDAELDQLFPPGYKVVPSPANYIPRRTPERKVMATPGTAQSGFFMQTESEFSATRQSVLNVQLADATLPILKQEHTQYFEKLLQDLDDDQLASEEARERRITKLLLKIKNGTPPQRKQAMPFVTDKAGEVGAGPLFSQILPLLMSVEDQERRMLIKVIDRALYKLDDLVRPYVLRIFTVIEPLLIDEDYHARIEGREIILNWAKAVGLATMISVMRPDIDNSDEYVRNTTARAFAGVASALGIPALLSFLRVVCKSKKSWQARHTAGVKITQQIAILMQCAVQCLRSLVEVIEHSVFDEQQTVRTITALSARPSAPYGIESFDTVITTLYMGIRTHRGKGLGASPKAVGNLMPLMDADYVTFHTREAMVACVREFASPDEEMKKIVLQVVKQAVSDDGVEAQYIIEEILPHFLNRLMALDRRNYKQLVETTVENAQKVGCSAIVGRIVDDLKDENELYRKMVVDTIEKVLETLGADDDDERLKEQLVDGILYAFQEQTSEDAVLMNGFGAIVTQLGQRVKPYLPQICGTVLWSLNYKSAKVRQQSADLIAGVMKLCDEEKLMEHLDLVLYEHLDEEYPEVLGSILGALNANVNVTGLTQMTPPIIKDLLPRLTLILKNHHEKMKENCIDLVGRIADRGLEHESARECMHIRRYVCFELQELLKTHKESIRRAAVKTCGYIAKAVVPHDVLATLLSNLKVQERRNRVCATVVAETCLPFTVFPALMNEYRVPSLLSGLLPSNNAMIGEEQALLVNNNAASAASEPIGEQNVAISAHQEDTKSSLLMQAPVLRFPGGLTVELSVENMLGAGSYGQVFLARAGNLKAAAKFIDMENELVDGIRISEVENEITIMKTISHPNILRLFCAQKSPDDRSAVLFMEVAEGGTLDSHIGKFGPMGESAGRKLFCQIISAFGYLHDKMNICHNDVKADNVFLDIHGNAKVADFGLAEKFLAGSEEEEYYWTRYMWAAYVDRYMPDQAPKISNGKEEDVWRLGVVVCEMVLGAPPFESASYTCAAADGTAILEAGIAFKLPEYTSPAFARLVKTILLKSDTRPSIADVAQSDWMTLPDGSPQLLVPPADTSLPPIKYEYIKPDGGRVHQFETFAGSDFYTHLVSQYAENVAPMPITPPTPPATDSGNSSEHDSSLDNSVSTELKLAVETDAGLDVAVPVAPPDEENGSSSNHDTSVSMHEDVDNVRERVAESKVVASRIAMADPKKKRRSIVGRCARAVGNGILRVMCMRVRRPDA